MSAALDELLGKIRAEALVRGKDWQKVAEILADEGEVTDTHDLMPCTRTASPLEHKSPSPEPRAKRRVQSPVSDPPKAAPVVTSFVSYGSSFTDVDFSADEIIGMWSDTPSQCAASTAVPSKSVESQRSRDGHSEQHCHKSDSKPAKVSVASEGHVQQNDNITEDEILGMWSDTPSQCAASTLVPSSSVKRQRSRYGHSEQHCHKSDSKPAKVSVASKRHVQQYDNHTENEIIGTWSYVPSQCAASTAFPSSSVKRQRSRDGHLEQHCHKSDSKPAKVSLASKRHVQQNDNHTEDEIIGMRSYMPSQRAASTAVPSSSVKRQRSRYRHSEQHCYKSDSKPAKVSLASKRHVQQNDNHTEDEIIGMRSYMPSQRAASTAVPSSSVKRQRSRYRHSEQHCYKSDSKPAKVSIASKRHVQQNDNHTEDDADGPGTAQSSSTAEESIELRIDQLLRACSAATGLPLRHAPSAAEKDGIPCEHPKKGLKTIWIVGDSFVHLAEDRAAGCSYGTRLGLPSDKCKVFWYGRRGLHWDQMQKLVEKAARRTPSPDILVIHAGGKNLTKTKSSELIFKVIGDIRSWLARWPGLKVVWSEIIQQGDWCNTNCVTTVAKSRIKVNKGVEKFVKANGGSVVRHEGINSKYAELYKGDGIHLSNMGLDVFNSSLQDKLERYI
ncbi:uncharacterized protein [Dendrobates tinctorius]|uniref:uncharacterized protein n=1 Tax=Dendrobates tinctorius TaxID=92724 RepID=UPI003CCA1FD0